MVQYIKKMNVNIGLVDPRNREVVFRILGKTKTLPLERPYDGMELVVDGVPLGKYTGPHIVKTEFGIKEELKGGIIGYVNLKPELYERPNLTKEQVEEVYKKEYEKVLESMLFLQVQPMMPSTLTGYEMA